MLNLYLYFYIIKSTLVESWSILALIYKTDEFSCCISLVDDSGLQGIINNANYLNYNNFFISFGVYNSDFYVLNMEFTRSYLKSNFDTKKILDNFDYWSNAYNNVIYEILSVLYVIPLNSKNLSMAVGVTCLNLDDNLNDYNYLYGLKLNTDFVISDILQVFLSHFVVTDNIFNINYLNTTTLCIKKDFAIVFMRYIENNNFTVYHSLDFILDTNFIIKFIIKNWKYNLLLCDIFSLLIYFQLFKKTMCFILWMYFYIFILIININLNCELGITLLIKVTNKLYSFDTLLNAVAPFISTTK